MVHGGDSDGLGDDGASAKGRERRDEHELDRKRKSRMRNQVNAVCKLQSREQDQTCGSRCEWNRSCGIHQHGKDNEINTDPYGGGYSIFDTAVYEGKAVLRRLVDSCGTDRAGPGKSICANGTKAKRGKNSVEQRRAEHVSDEQDAKLRVLPLVSGDVGKQKGRTRIIDKADEMAGFFM